MSKTAKIFFALLFFALAAYGQQREKIAIINTVDDGNPQISHLELSYLTDKLREIAGNVLPDKNYDVVTEECYNNQESNCQKYGRLYNWNTAKTACPKGWHLPSDTEWDVLMKSVNPACAPKANCAKAGKFLNAKSGWINNGNGTDAFGFSALPGGYGFSGGSFNYVGNLGYWWSASEHDITSAYSRTMGYSSEGVIYSYYIKSTLCSVRCLQD